MPIKVDRTQIPETVKEAKKWWRREIRRTLNETTAEYRADASAKICAAFSRMDEYRDASTILAYCSVGAEVDTIALINRMLADGKRVCLPVCTDLDEEGHRDMTQQGMDARLITSLEGLKEGAYGIPEPTEEDPLVDPEEIDLIMLPCLACDTSCQRIGHGAGYYDRYLEVVRDDCRLVAVCYDAVLAEDLPTTWHDKPVDAVITENAIYRP